MSTIDASTPQEVAKAALLEEIDTFVQEKITFADEQVALLAQAKVAPGDVVLTYAFSSAVYNTFVAAQKVKMLLGICFLSCTLRTLYILVETPSILEAPMSSHDVRDYGIFAER